MQGSKLDKAGMKKLHADHQAAMGAGDVDAAMAFLAPEPEVRVAGYCLRGADEVRANKVRWIERGALQSKGRGLTIEAYDEDRQMMMLEGWADNEIEDGTVERQWIAVVLELENGLMKRERFYCLDPKMIEMIQRTVYSDT